MKRSILKLAIGALMLMGSGLASAVLLGTSATLNNTSVTGDLVAITTSTPNPNTITGLTEFSACVDGPTTNTCATTGLFIGIDIGDTTIDFSFSGSTGAGESFFFDLVFAPNITIVSVNQDTLALNIGSFSFISAMGNVIRFEGNDNGDGDIDAIGGVNIHLDLELQAVPEPGPLVLLALALAGMGFVRRRAR